MLNCFIRSFVCMRLTVTGDFWSDYVRIYSLQLKLECGPMPNVMAAQSNIDGVFCESSVIPFLVPRRKIWLTSAAGVPCSNAAKTHKTR